MTGIKLLKGVTVQFPLYSNHKPARLRWVQGTVLRFKDRSRIIVVQSDVRIKPFEVKRLLLSAVKNGKRRREGA